MCPNETLPNPHKHYSGPGWYAGRVRPAHALSTTRLTTSSERSGAYIKVDPMFDALRADARYPELLRLMARAAARSSRDLRAS
jgi:hypothetical protein